MEGVIEAAVLGLTLSAVIFSLLEYLYGLSIKGYSPWNQGKSV